MRIRLLSSAVLALAAFGASEAFAGGEIFDPTVDATSVANGGAVIINATVKSFPPSAGRWVAEVFAGAGECLRLAVTSQFADLEIVVVAPNGSAFRDDDGGGALRPLVKIRGTPNNGWYTVSIGHFNGGAVTGNFTLAYGRYNSANANCNTPTVPRAALAEVAEAAKAPTPAAAPAPGAPGAR